MSKYNLCKIGIVEEKVMVLVRDSRKENWNGPHRLLTIGDSVDYLYTVWCEETRCTQGYKYAYQPEDINKYWTQEQCIAWVANATGWQVKYDGHPWQNTASLSFAATKKYKRRKITLHPDGKVTYGPELEMRGTFEW